MPTITDTHGNARPVKNLGWLLRNWQRVESFAVTPPADGRPGQCWEVHLTANLRRGGTYSTDFGSLSVLFRFLNRPVFRGLPLSFHLPDSAARWIIGSPAYNAAMKLDGNPNPEAYRAHIAAIKAGE